MFVKSYIVFTISFAINIEYKNYYTSLQSLRIQKKCKSYELVNFLKKSGNLSVNALTLIIFLICCFVLFNQPETDGYIAVVLPKLHESDLKSQNLISNDEYQMLVRGRSAMSWFV